LSKVLASAGKYTGLPLIIFVDEWDKLYISGNNGELANEVTTGVQNEFLKLLEAPTTQVFGDYGKYNDIDISKTLFIFAGAFNNDPHINLDKLRKFGVKTEFLGRVGLIYNTEKLSLKDLCEILDNSSLLNDYLKIFSKVNKTEVIETVKDFITKNYDNNTVGARSINTLIHQYFIKGGKLGVEDAEDVTFQETLDL